MALNMVSKYLIIKEGIIAQTTCGTKIPDLIIYEHISQYSIWIALSLTIGGILMDKKLIKRILMILVLFPLLAWVYVQFVVDYASLKKEIFSYNAMAEATLANIAEAQDRYKSEQGTYIDDLRKLYSHIGLSLIHI